MFIFPRVGISHWKPRSIKKRRLNPITVTGTDRNGWKYIWPKNYFWVFFYNISSTKRLHAFSFQTDTIVRSNGILLTRGTLLFVRFDWQTSNGGFWKRTFHRNARPIRVTGTRRMCRKSHVTAHGRWSPKTFAGHAKPSL